MTQVTNPPGGVWRPLVSSIKIEFRTRGASANLVIAVITIILIILTIANAIVCMINFDKGLKPHITKRKMVDEEEKNSIEMSHAAHPMPSRMTID